jgi:hypothetical protein
LDFQEMVPGVGKHYFRIYVYRHMMVLCGNIGICL